MWLTILPILTPSESATANFPSLQEVEFLVRLNVTAECSDEELELLHDFVLARKGTLTRLAIPPINDMDILNPLRAHIAHLEVCFAHIFFLSRPIIPRRCQSLFMIDSSFIRDLGVTTETHC
jgi:hypothetical protein